MDREQQIATLNLQGWEPCAINYHGSPIQGITRAEIFYYAQRKVNMRDRTFGYVRFVDTTTALQRDWDDFNDVDLDVLYRQAQVYMEVGHDGP